MNKAARPEKTPKLLEAEDLVLEDFGYLEMPDDFITSVVLSYRDEDGIMRAYDFLGQCHSLDCKDYGKTWRIWAPEVLPIGRDREEKAWLT